MKLQDVPGIKQLEFDIPGRRLTVFHNGSTRQIDQSVATLGLGSEVLSDETAEFTGTGESVSQKKLLWTVLAINFAFFIIEMTTGLISRSMGLVADSLDMLADAFVYGISLLAVGGSIVRKKNVARVAGYFQILLAVTGFMEVLRRFFGAAGIPDFTTMIVVSSLALAANSVSLYLLQRSKSREEAHMKASMIFTSNDVIINLGVIAAGLLVHWLNSGIPDLAIGTIVFAIVVRGAMRILKIAQ